MRATIYQWIQALQSISCGFCLVLANIIRTINNLALEVRNIDGIKVKNTDCANASCAKV
jgi:hypothetical protein